MSSGTNERIEHTSYYLLRSDSLKSNNRKKSLAETFFALDFHLIHSPSCLFHSNQAQFKNYHLSTNDNKYKTINYFP
jgi:hypothetical protein